MSHLNANSLEYVDRVIVLRINTEEMQVETLLHAPLSDALELMSDEKGGKKDLPLSRLVKKSKPASELKVVKVVKFDDYRIRELENGRIEVERAGSLVVPVKPALRELAKRFNVSLLNSNGNPLNTRQLGSQLIKDHSKNSCRIYQPCGASPGSRR